MHLQSDLSHHLLTVVMDSHKAIEHLTKKDHPAVPTKKSREVGEVRECQLDCELVRMEEIERIKLQVLSNLNEERKRARKMFSMTQQ